MPSPRRRLPPEQRERQVLDAAALVFSRKGFHDASMDEIADEAGVSKPMVYTHGGGSKDELFARCIRRAANRLLASVAAPVEADPQLRLYRGLLAFFATVTTHRDGWLVLYRQARTGPFAGDVGRARHRIVARVAELLADQDVAPSAALPVASTLVGAAEGLADWWLDAGAGDGIGPEELAAHLMSVLWPGLSALRDGRVWTVPAGTEPNAGPGCFAVPVDDAAPVNDTVPVDDNAARTVRSSRDVAADAAALFELVADPAQQPRWDGNDNLAGAEPGQRVRAVGDVFRMTLTNGGVRENHVVEFDEGSLLAWEPSEVDSPRPGHLWRWEFAPLGDGRTRVTHTYDWSRLSPADEMRNTRARATTEDSLRASVDRLAALAEA